MVHSSEVHTNNLKIISSWTESLPAGHAHGHAHIFCTTNTLAVVRRQCWLFEFMHQISHKALHQVENYK